MVVMDVRRFTAVAVAVVVLLGCVGDVLGNFVFQVENKFKASGIERTLSALRAHDTRRHGRFLSAVDVPLGGNGLPSSAGLYFTKIGLGTPSKDFYVQVDTGSDILWVNCAGCERCPSKSDHGIKLTLFNPHKSKTSSTVGCGDDFCISTYDGLLPGCKAGLSCSYSVSYGDGSATAGTFVKDTILLNQVTANAKISQLNASIIFGCGAKQTGDLASGTETAVDGIFGFGQANSSILSQLAAAGKVRKEFAHCLDVVKGGGIFAIGDVVSPVVKTTPLVANMPHYNVQMKAIEVGGSVLDVPTYVFDTGSQKGAIIDSGTTLAYLPQVVYQPMMNKILARQSGLKLRSVDEQFSCFMNNKNVDDEFPTVTFHFEGSLKLTVYPHEYLFKVRDNEWCFGWQNGGLTRDGSEMILLGDLALSNKLVVYDTQNQTIGWTEYNCTSSIKLKDEKSGTIYTVGAHNLSSALSLTIGRMLTLLSVFFAILQSLCVH